MRESRDRVRAAIQCAQFEFPNRRITVNLAPADLPKDGGRFDLPIALGILAASGLVDVQALGRVELLGELALTGELRAIEGVLPAALAAAGSDRTLIVPAGNGAEAALAWWPRADRADLAGGRGALEWRARLAGGGDRPARRRCGIRRRPRRRARPGVGAARAGSRRRRRAPPAAHRAARLRQDAARLAPARPTAGSERCRGAGDGDRRLGQRPRLRPNAMAHSTFSLAAPLGQRGVAGRRRPRPATGRDLARAQRRAVPGRTGGMEPAHARRRCASRSSPA